MNINKAPKFDPRFKIPLKKYDDTEEIVEPEETVEPEEPEKIEQNDNPGPPLIIASVYGSYTQHFDNAEAQETISANNDFDNTEGQETNSANNDFEETWDDNLIIDEPEESNSTCDNTDEINYEEINDMFECTEYSMQEPRSPDSPELIIDPDLLFDPNQPEEDTEMPLIDTPQPLVKELLHTTLKPTGNEITQIQEVFQSPLLDSDHATNVVKSERLLKHSVPRTSEKVKKLKRKPSETSTYCADTYPSQLKKLLKPLECHLCKVKSNSPKSSTMHYESKSHLKKLNFWLEDWSKKTGEPMPKIPKIRAKNVEGPTGPNALHCTACDLPLTSVQHANQHYLGKKHRLVVARKSSPSGPGHYSREGKWIRESRRNDIRFGIGQSFVKDGRAEISEKIAEKAGTTSGIVVTSTTTTIDASQTDSVLNRDPRINTTTVSTTISTIAPSTNLIENNVEMPNTEIKNPLIENAMLLSTEVTSTFTAVDPSNPKFCKVCKISVTSEPQMQAHLKGSKHAKKLKVMDAPPHAAPNDTILSSLKEINFYNSKSDNSIYRTPSGQYYCQSCDLSFGVDNEFNQHKGSKKHLKKVKELIAASLPATC